MPTTARPSVNAEQIHAVTARDCDTTEWFLGNDPMPSVAVWLVDGLTLPVRLRPTSEFNSRLRIGFRGADVDRARRLGIIVNGDINVAILTRAEVASLGLWFAPI